MNGAVHLCCQPYIPTSLSGALFGVPKLKTTVGSFVLQKMVLHSYRVDTHTQAESAGSTKIRKQVRKYYATHDSNVHYTDDHGYCDGKRAMVTLQDNANEQPNERIMPKPNMLHSKPASTNRLEERQKRRRGTRMVGAAARRSAPSPPPMYGRLITPPSTR